MDYQQNLLTVALLLVSFMIWQAWQSDHTQKTITAKSTQEVYNKALPNLNNPTILSKIRKDQFIQVKTDVLSLIINTYGGDIEQAFLLSYPDKLDSKQPFHLLETSKEFIYQAQTGLTGIDGPDNPSNKNRPTYTTDNNTYILASNQNELCVPLTYTASDGAIYTKTFILKRNSFALNINYNINNRSLRTLKINLFGQLKQSINLPKYRKIKNSNVALHAYRGAAYSASDNKYQKYSFKDIKNKQLSIDTEGGWIAMLQQYFATAWIPSIQGKNTIYATDLDNGQVAIGIKSSTINIVRGSNCELKSQLWLGPEIQDKMSVVAPNLDLVVDYGWLWFISQPLFTLLKFIYKYVGNWGFSIIIITFIVRGAMYPLTKSQYISMVKMRMLQPKLAEIRGRLGNDRHRQGQEIMALYKTEGVNPLGGCLPLIIQMPIFLALYYVLSGSVELRHAPFALWVRDLSSQDPYYILPLLMGMTMFFIQKMSPSTVTDQLQQKIMNLFPVIFTLFFLWFPAGLVLYYIVNNLVTIIQQYIICLNLEKIGLNNKR